MTLLVVTPWPLAASGGGSRLVREMASALATHHGVIVTVAAGPGAPGSPACEPIPTDTIREVRLPFAPDAARSNWAWRLGPTRTPSSCLDGLAAVVSDVRPGMLLYVSHYADGAEQAAELARTAGIPFAIVPAIHLDHRDHVSRAARALYARADMVVCLSEVERTWLVEHARVAPERAVYLEVGWQGDVTGTRGADRRHTVQLLTVSAFARHKQVDHQLHALHRLRETHGLAAHLTVAGALSHRAVLDRWQALRRRLGLESDVEFHPDCSNDELRRLYRDADYFLFTSRSESFGFAVLDAIGSGVTPVVYPHPTYGALVKTAGFGIITPRPTARALADTLADAIKHRPAPDHALRVQWLETRAWPAASAPIADAFIRLVRYHSRDGSR